MVKGWVDAHVLLEYTLVTGFEALLGYVVAIVIAAATLLAAALAAIFVAQSLANPIVRLTAMAKSLAEGGPNALARTKLFLQQFSRQSMSIEEAAKGSAAPRLTDECRQGLQAFFNKQPAPWLAATR